MPEPFSRAQQLAGLLFHLFFFFGDVGNHVAQNVERSHSGISRATHGLHGDRHHRLQTKRVLQRSQRDDQADCRAIGIRDHESARLLAPCLAFEQLDVVVIDFRNDQRHIALHPQRAGIGNHGASGFGEARLHFGRNGGIQRGKNNFGRALGRRGRNRMSATCAGIAVFSFQRAASRIRTAFGTVGGRQPRHLKPGMMLQHLHKALPDDAGSAQDSYRDFRSHKGFLGFYNTLHRLDEHGVRSVVANAQRRV